MSASINNTNNTSTIQALAKMCTARPEAAIRLILAEGDVNRHIAALRVFPQSLQALWRAENASRDMRAVIEAELEMVGLTMMS